MGSGDWFKSIISRKKTKQDKSRKSEGSASEQSDVLKQRNLSKKTLNKIPTVPGVAVEDVAATMIQTAFRGYKARKTLRYLKGMARLQLLTQGHSVEKQTSVTLNYIQSWSRIQSQISTRRLSMVTEGRIRQKKLERQLKVEAKLHDLEVEWCGGSETKEEIVVRVQQRVEAAVKRERAMAYAFSHQWRAKSGQNQQFVYEFGKGDWGWSWMERWIASRPWESRLPNLQSESSDKTKTKAAKLAQGVRLSVNSASSNGKGSVKRLSNPTKDEKPIASEAEIEAIDPSPPESKDSKVNNQSQTNAG